MTDPARGERLRSYLNELYGEPRAAEVLPRLLDKVEHHFPATERKNERSGEAYSQSTVMLITYGDQVRQQGEAPLETLRHFLLENNLEDQLSAVHILPFYPYSSDDGFSVINYRTVDRNLGKWPDVEALAEHFDLMFDLVLNHISSRSAWFLNYLDGDPPWHKFFIEVDPKTDLSAVVRPRSLPLLTPFETSRGRRHVWTTFSDDQIDLNFAEPDVLVEMADVMLEYLARGARILRLDAIAYLWKEIGTSCINDKRTHTVVKLLRALCEEAAQDTLILTETNLPHDQNVSYFGDGDEAHVVYQFSLPPLLLDAMTTGDAGPLVRWLTDLEPPPPGTTFLNFTASHDGIGVRPLEGLVPPERLGELQQEVLDNGGRVSTRRLADGSDSPYELNISYFNAVGGNDPEFQVRRFLATQAVMLALKGIPAVYFHSLVGTPNDLEGLAKTGRARSINRRRYEMGELRNLIQDGGPQTEVFDGYQKMLTARVGQPAFHPDADQQVWPVDAAAVAAFLRTPENGARVLVAVNFSSEERLIEMPAPSAQDLLTDAPPKTRDGRLVLTPYQAAWLTLDD